MQSEASKQPQDNNNNNNNLDTSDTDSDCDSNSSSNTMIDNDVSPRWEHAGQPKTTFSILEDNVNRVRRPSITAPVKDIIIAKADCLKYMMSKVKEQTKMELIEYYDFIAKIMPLCEKRLFGQGGLPDEKLTPPDFPRVHTATLIQDWRQGTGVYGGVATHLAGCHRSLYGSDESLTSVCEPFTEAALYKYDVLKGGCAAMQEAFEAICNEAYFAPKHLPDFLFTDKTCLVLSKYEPKVDSHKVADKREAPKPSKAFAKSWKGEPVNTSCSRTGTEHQNEKLNKTPPKKRPATAAARLRPNEDHWDKVLGRERNCRARNNALLDIDAKQIGIKSRTKKIRKENVTKVTSGLHKVNSRIKQVAEETYYTGRASSTSIVNHRPATSQNLLLRGQIAEAVKPRAVADRQVTSSPKPRTTTQSPIKPTTKPTAATRGQVSMTRSNSKPGLAGRTTTQSSPKLRAVSGKEEMKPTTKPTAATRKQIISHSQVTSIRPTSKPTVAGGTSTQTSPKLRATSGKEEMKSCSQLKTTALDDRQGTSSSKPWSTTHSPKRPITKPTAATRRQVSTTRTNSKPTVAGGPSTQTSHKPRAASGKEEAKWNSSTKTVPIKVTTAVDDRQGTCSPKPRTTTQSLKKQVREDTRNQNRVLVQAKWNSSTKRAPMKVTDRTKQHPMPATFEIDDTVLPSPPKTAPPEGRDRSGRRHHHTTSAVSVPVKKPAYEPYKKWPVPGTLQHRKKFTCTDEVDKATKPGDHALVKSSLKEGKPHAIKASTREVTKERVLDKVQPRPKQATQDTCRTERATSKSLNRPTMARNLLTRNQNSARCTYHSTDKTNRPSPSPAVPNTSRYLPAIK